MNEIRSAFLDAASSAADVVSRSVVAERWHEPSALRGMTVGALAGHLASQVFHVPRLLAAPNDEDPIPLLEHYARAPWTDADHDDEANVRIRASSEGTAADGAESLVEQLTADVARCRELLACESTDRVVHLPWGPWSLTLDDFLVTRMMELAVHSDDLAVSVGLDTPELPARALEPVLALLSALAVRRHGQSAVLRALSRAERAPSTIAAF